MENGDVFDFNISDEDMAVLVRRAELVSPLTLLCTTTTCRMGWMKTIEFAGTHSTRNGTLEH